jgi:hypothetical protein
MRQLRVHQFRMTTAAAVLVILGLAAAVCQADTAKNPLVRNWAKFKKGSSATLAATISAGNFSVQMEKTDKLVDVTGDKITIETTVSTNVGGQQRSNPPTTHTIDSNIEKGDWTEVGHEKIEAAGKTFDCTVVEGKSTAPTRGGAPSDAKARMWYSDDVPGGMVQMKVNANGHEIVYKLTAFEVK